jgi:hypothetical protein
MDNDGAQNALNAYRVLRDTPSWAGGANRAVAEDLLDRTFPSTDGNRIESIASTVGETFKNRHSIPEREI